MQPDQGIDIPLHSMSEEWFYLTNNLVATFFPYVGIKEPHRNPFYNSKLLSYFLSVESQ